MKTKIISMFAVIVVCLSIFTGCVDNQKNANEAQKTSLSQNDSTHEAKVVKAFEEALKVYDSLKIPKTQEEVIQFANDKGASEEMVEHLESKPEFCVLSNDYYAVTIYSNGEEAENRKDLVCKDVEALTEKDYEGLRDIETGITLDEFYELYGKSYVFGLQERSDGRKLIRIDFSKDHSRLKNWYAFSNNKLTEIEDTFGEYIGNTKAVENAVFNNANDDNTYITYNTNNKISLNESNDFIENQEKTKLSDFSEYEYKDIGSGIYLYVLPLADYDGYLAVGSADGENLLYVILCSNNER